MLDYLKQSIPDSVKFALRNLLAGENQDATRQRLFGALAPLIPTRGQMFDGPPTFEEFKANGEEFLHIYTRHCGMRPDERMLDIGFGIGRKTIPLLGYFNAGARYLGVDIKQEGIHWCSSKITPAYPNFRFQWIDVHSKYYNRRGKFRPEDYRFPLPDNEYTFVMLGSVFTHMLLEAVDNYVAEIARMLAPGGRCLISYFLLNPASVALIDDGKSAVNFKFQRDGCRLASEQFPELATALPEQAVRDIYARHGLRIEWVKYGSWCGRADPLSYQDLVFAVRE